MNLERLNRIAAIELADPQRLEMLTWESSTSHPCGTTRCIAGWTLFDAVSAPIWGADDSFTPEFLAFMAANYPDWDPEDEEFPEFPEFAAANLLGLTEEQAELLFHTSNARARGFLHRVRTGHTEAQLAEYIDGLAETGW